MKLLILCAFVALTPYAVEEASEPPCRCEKQETFPMPDLQDNTLFYIQRSPNHNTIMYDLNEVAGELDSDEPVRAYWLRYQEQGQREELSFIQEHYAYGVKAKKLDNDRYELRFVSYKKMPFYLVRSSGNKQFRIHATVDGKKILVERIFLQIEGGSFWLPNVVCVEVKGSDPVTGEPSVLNLKP